ncbi:hypothetical protein GCM10010423_53190 [Streptomyces levis]|uniref:Uncharacterized protein n=1 Tax=Streptomyces levis TaxID=285566 RepID=A0ABP6B8G3_9ACTN
MIRSAAHQGSQISRMSPAATPPAAILAFFDMTVASFAATAALCPENGPALPAVPFAAPETSLRRTPEATLRRRTATAEHRSAHHRASIVTHLTSHPHPRAPKVLYSRRLRLH